MKKIVLSALALLVAAAVIWNIFTAIRQSGDTAVADLVVGDCLAEFYEDQTRFVETVLCSTNHVQEVVGKVDDLLSAESPSADFPGVEALNTTAQVLCVDAFENNTGIEYNGSNFQITGISPIEQAWLDGDRGLICLAANSDSSPIEGSIVQTGDIGSAVDQLDN